MDFPVWILEQLHVYVHLLKLSFKYHHLFFYSREIVSQKMTSKRFVSTFYSFQLKYKAPYTIPSRKCLSLIGTDRFLIQSTQPVLPRILVTSVELVKNCLSLFKVLWIIEAHPKPLFCHAVILLRKLWKSPGATWLCLPRSVTVQQSFSQLFLCCIGIN